jgi:trigger factor
LPETNAGETFFRKSLAADLLLTAYPQAIVASPPRRSYHFLQGRTVFPKALTVTCARTIPDADGITMADERKQDALTVHVDIEKPSQCERQITFTVPFEEVQKELDALYEEAKKTAEVPGFRPGKAPRQVVETRFGRVFRERALDRIRYRAYDRAVREHNIKAIRVPEFQDISYEKGQPFTFQAKVEVIPDVTLPEYKGIRIERKEPEPTTDADVAAEIDRLRKELAQFVLVEDRPLRDQDYAVITYEEESDGKTEKFDRRVIHLVPGVLLPGFAENLRGMRPGEKREFQIQISDDYSDKDVAGRTIRYRVELNEIRVEELPEVNDELAKKLHAESVEQLKKRIFEALTASRERQAEEEEVEQVITYLLKNTDFEVPKSALADGTRSRAGRRIRAGLQAGVPREYFEEKREEIIKDAAAETFANLKLQIILPQIAQAEGITVSDEEVEARIQRIAVARNLSKDDVKKTLAEEGTLESLRDDIQEQKVINFLLNSAIKG